MKSRSSLLTSLLAASLLFFASHAHSDNHMSAPPVKSQGSATYITGGVTVDERDVMKPLAKDYNLRMSFALSVGNYVSDVKVTVMSGKKTVLDVVSDGPFLYVKLPAGKYSINAEYEGKTVRKSATIGPKKGASLNFVWPGVKEKYED